MTLRMRIKSDVVRIGLKIPAPGHGATVTGTEYVIDGDKIAIGTARIRLHGIDALETGQRCELSYASSGAATKPRLTAWLA